MHQKHVIMHSTIPLIKFSLINLIFYISFKIFNFKLKLTVTQYPRFCPLAFDKKQVGVQIYLPLSVKLPY